MIAAGMDNGRRRRASLAVRASTATIALACLFPQAARAQVGSSPTPPPVFQAVDQNGVELQSGRLVLTIASIRIGNGSPGSLGYDWSTDSSRQQEVYGYVKSAANPTNASQTVYSVVVGGSTETFTTPTGAYAFTQDQGRSSVLSYNAGTDRFTYTRTDGAVAEFSRQLVSGSPVSGNYKIVSLTYPAGQALTYHYAYRPYTDSWGTTFHDFDVSAVASSLGYQLRLGYTNRSVTDAVVFNMATENCAPTAATCTLAGAWPRLSWDAANGRLVDATGRWVHWGYTSNSSGAQVTFTYPSGRVLKFNQDSLSRVTSFTDGKGTWTYQYPSPTGGATLAFNPDVPAPRQITWSTSTGLIGTDIPMAGQNAIAINYTYDAKKRVTRITRTNNTTGALLADSRYAYDLRGNLIETRQVSPTPGTPADIVVSAGFPSSCTNSKMCNKPEYVTDARGNRTDMAYDPVHGGVTSMTLPPMPNGVRPQTRFSYTAQSANYLNGSGAVIAGAPAFLLTSTSQCVTGSSCAGTAAEVKTTTVYSANDALLPVSASTAAGDGSVSATTSSTYYPTGDVKTVDGPLPGTADTSRAYYDAQRRATGAIGPDPDGSGLLARRAVRNTFNDDGLVASADIGTAAGQGDGDMATFQLLQQTAAQYDAQGRKAVETGSAGGAIQTRTDYAYSAAGALQCTAVRMNPATFSGPAAPACTQSAAGSYGPDRITRYAYDYFFHVTDVTESVGTPLERVEIAHRYDSAGRLLSVSDAKGNKTSYVYDQFGRLWQTQFASLSSPGTSNAGDYEQLSYDAASNVTQRRLRDGQVINLTYDALDRTTLKDMPGTEPDVSYSYDNLGRVTNASKSGASLAFGYDALGRQVSAANAQGTLAYQFDAGGRRTRTTWPDGFYVTYDYLVTGEATAIRESGAASGVGVLATFSYDNLGRRTSATRGNGTSNTMGYDAASRLTSLNHDLAGTAGDQALTFPSYNPAGQMLSRTGSNDSYAWNQAYTVSRSYSANGLNQYTASGAVQPSYDARGNMTNGGAGTLAYNSENLLVSAPSLSLSYDATGRLAQTVGATTTRFLYDGNDLVGEYDSAGNVLRRYVHGPGTDDPVVWYEGSGTGDRRWLHEDERGSIIATSNASGSVTAFNSYDSFGIPGSSNTGRFQYTGQIWLPELGMYNFKARIYSPSLGRFLQADPIGFADGMNVYAYVGNDPMNATDPSGLDTCVGGPYGGGGCQPRYPDNPRGYFDNTGQFGYYYSDGAGLLYFRGSSLDYNYFTGLGSSYTPDMAAAAQSGAGVIKASAGTAPRGGQHVCTGNAYVLKGNDAFLRKPTNGAFGTRITPNSVAVVPRQWTGQPRWDTSFLSFGPNTFGFASNGRQGLAFDGITDVVNHRELASNSLAAQDIIMARAPGQLILEVTGGQDLGVGAKVFLFTDNPRGCPQGTAPYRER
jgi:RHS repeat-associated protein